MNFVKHELRRECGSANRWDQTAGCVYLVLQVSPKKEVARSKVRGSRWPFHVAMTRWPNSSLRRSRTAIKRCAEAPSCTHQRFRNAPPPPLHLKMLLKLSYKVVVHHFQIIQSIYISVKEKWPDYLLVATKSDPDCTVNFCWLQLTSKLNAGGCPAAEAYSLTLWVLTWPFMAKPSHLQQRMTAGTLRFICNGQPAIAQTAFAEHNLEK